MADREKLREALVQLTEGTHSISVEPVLQMLTFSPNPGKWSNWGCRLVQRRWSDKTSRELIPRSLGMLVFEPEHDTAIKVLIETARIAQLFAEQGEDPDG